MCIGFIFPAYHAGNDAAAADAARKVRIGIYDNSPKVYLDNGVAAGLFPDILNYISQREKWQLEYAFGTWEEGLDRLEKGEIDVMVDVALSEGRQQQFDFTNETVLSSWGVIYVRKNSAVGSFQGLDGKKIAILESSVYYGGPEGVDQYIKAFGLKTEFVKVSNYADAFILLDKGEVDAAVVSRVFALANQKNYPNIKQTDIFFSPTELRFALTKGAPGNGYLIERLDYWMKKLKDGYEGVYQRSLERNNLAEKSVNKMEIPRWVRTTGFTAAIILSLLWPIVIGLKCAGMIKNRKKPSGRRRKQPR